jgi:hypothetical protein
MNQLTVAEAIEQGYTHFGFEGRDYQHLNPIEDFDTSSGEPEECLLFGKEPIYVPSVTAEQIAELIGDQVQCEVDDNTADDSNDACDIVMALDFEPVAKMINDALAHKKYYSLIRIKLVP